MKSTVFSDTQPWYSTYLLGIQIIDEQHIKFFELFDRLTELNKHEHNREPILDIINELVDFTHYHFGAEENLMFSAQVPEREIHLAEHQLFVNKLEVFKAEYDYNNNFLLEQMLVFMRKWLLIHILETDHKYVDPVKLYLSQKNN